MTGDFIKKIRFWHSRLKSIISRIAFLIQYYLGKFWFKLKKRAPLLKKLHLNTFPAIHLKKMDWLDFLVKFSGEALVVALALLVALMNLYFFAGEAPKTYADNSLAAKFLSYHPDSNRKLYAKNSSIVTAVAKPGGLIAQAQADELVSLSNDSASPQPPQNADMILDGSQDILAKPNPDSIRAFIVRGVKIYRTKAGDTLKSIAAQNNISINSLRWSNPELAGDTLKPDWYLRIPPLDGVVVTADANTDFADLAVKYNPEKYNANKNVRDAAAAQLLDNILSYNALGYASDINPGDILVIPGGQLASPPAPAPKPKAKNKAPAPDTGINVVTSIGDGYDGVNHTFPRGYCTYYVASKMKITFGGNAKSWLANAKASGYVTGNQPAPRSAVVMTGRKGALRRYGHVAYVDSVNGDGTITVSEMNYDHFNRVDIRTISVNDPSIRGYIYP